MSAGAVAATVDAPQDPGLLETRLRLAKLGQVRAAAGAIDGVPAAFRDRRDVRRRALSRQSAVFLTVLFIIPLYVCPSYDAHTPSIVSEVSLYITWFLLSGGFLVPVLGLVGEELHTDGVSARRRRRGASVVRGPPHRGRQCVVQMPYSLTLRHDALHGTAVRGASVKPLGLDGCPHSGRLNSRLRAATSRQEAGAGALSLTPHLTPPPRPAQPWPPPRWKP